VPVDGEWVTIAVVAERGPIRLSQTGGNDGPAEEKDSKDSGSTATKHRSGPRKHTTIKLIDMGGASSDGKGKAVRGDAYLNMLLFEADSASTSKHDSSRKVERSYKGGSGGAFENSARFSEGSVIAICSPRLLKPYQVRV
jgi:minichromosome maintenance protein 10